MNPGVLVEPTCDLPASFFERYGIAVLPIMLHSKNLSFEDHRDPEESSTFYSQDYRSFRTHAITRDFHANALDTLLREQLIYEHDQILIFAPHLKINKSLQVFRETIFNNQQHYERLRQGANIRNALKIRIIESQSALSGYGLMVYEGLRLVKERARSLDQIKKPLEDFKKQLETYFILGGETFSYQTLGNTPFSLNWLAVQKLKLKKDSPIFSIDAAGLRQSGRVSSTNSVAEFLEFLYDRLTQINLTNNLVNISYAGKLSSLRVLPQFGALTAHVQSKGGRLVYSVMSPTNGLTLGKGAISASLAGSPYSI